MARRRALITRRTALAGTALLPFSLVPALDGFGSAIDARLRELEKMSGGRLGVAIFDTRSGTQSGHRAGERFPMCSTFKFLAVAAVLGRVDRQAERLDRRIAYTQVDLLEYAPVTREHVGEGAMTLSDLCSAAITVSDNTAANLLLSTIGGPAGLTAFVRTLGDSVTRLDRIEPALNEARPGDIRDTTTPAAMLRNLKTLLVGNTLSTSSRDRLIGWLAATTTGGDRLRAGFPPDWRVGDKTGSGEHGTTNDIAIAWPPGRAPVLIAAYLTETSAALEARTAVLADIARAVAAM